MQHIVLTLFIRILTYESALIPGSTIGKHLRHSLDHYKLLLDAIPQRNTAAKPLQVNYDMRMRQTDMERDPQAALQAFQAAESSLDGAFQQVSLDTPLCLTALTPYRQQLASSFGREVRALASSSPALRADVLLRPFGSSGSWRCTRYTTSVCSRSSLPASSDWTFQTSLALRPARLRSVRTRNRLAMYLRRSWRPAQKRSQRGSSCSRLHEVHSLSLPHRMSSLLLHQFLYFLAASIAFASSARKGWPSDICCGFPLLPQPPLLLQAGPAVLYISALSIALVYYLSVEGSLHARCRLYLARHSLGCCTGPGPG